MPPLALLPNQPLGATDIVPGYNDTSSIYAGAQGRTTDSSAPDPYQAIIEAQKYQREQNDQQYKIQLQQLKNQTAQIAVQQGQAAASAWYQRQEVELAKNKLTEDQRQYDQTQAELKRQFDQTAGEKSREFDLTTAEGQRQYNASLQENQRQFNAAQTQHASEFQSTQQETQREFNTTSSGFDANGAPTLANQQFLTNASGYLPNGQSTLERDKFGNQALFDWTKQAIDLASTPEDWVKEKRYTSGVAANAGAIPGLNWTQGGQVGNTTQTDPSQSNSLGNVLGQIGVQPPGSSPVGSNQMDDPNFAAGVMQFVHDNGGSVQDGIAWMNSKPPDDANRLAAIRQGMANGYGSRQQAAPVAAGPTGAAQFGQGVTSGGVPAHATDSMGTTAGSPEVFTGGSSSFNENSAGGYGQQPAAPRAPGMMDWAYQAANMVPTKLNLSPDEQQIYDTANAFATNPQGSAPGWWEGQDPSTQKMIQGAAQAQGHDWAATMNRYNRSRWGGGGLAAAA